MTEKVEKPSGLSQGFGEGAVRIKLPDFDEVEVYLVRLPDGSLVARTAEELSREKLAGKGEVKK